MTPEDQEKILDHITNLYPVFTERLAALVEKLAIDRHTFLIMQSILLSDIFVEYNYAEEFMDKWFEQMKIEVKKEKENKCRVS